MAVYKSRKEVPINETWDLERVLGGKTLKQLEKEILELSPKVVEAFKNRYGSAEALVKYHVLAENFEKLFWRFICYVQLNQALDALSPLASRAGAMQMKLANHMQAVASEMDEALANKQKIQKFLKDERLADQRRFYELIFRKEKHVLPAELASFQAQVQPALHNSYEIYSVLQDAEVKYSPAVDGKGKKHEVSQQSILDLRKSPDRVLRKSAYESYNAGELALKETFSRLLGTHFSAQQSLAKGVNFNDYVESCLFEDNVPKELVTYLYDTNKRYFPLYAKFAKARRTFLAASLGMTYEELRPFDYGVNFFPNVGKFSVKNTKKLILDSVSVLGDEYRQKVQKALNTRWVDYHMTPNKAPGAFSATNRVFDEQLILMNFNHDLESVTTLAHEMGHSMHSLYCKTKNTYATNEYPAFYAEVASLFSELLLTEEILSKSTDDRVKFNALDLFLRTFSDNFFMAAAESEYESAIIDKLVKNEPVSSWSEFSKIFSAVKGKYDPHPDWTKSDPEAFSIRAVKVMHHYFGFYLYKYSFGILGAVGMFAQLKKDGQKGVRNYLAFISSGSQRWPLDVLRDVGVDLQSPTTAELGFSVFSDFVDQYNALGKKLFKNAKKLEKKISTRPASRKTKRLVH